MKSESGKMEGEGLEEELDMVLDETRIRFHKMQEVVKLVGELADHERIALRSGDNNVRSMRIRIEDLLKEISSEDLVQYFK